MNKYTQTILWAIAPLLFTLAACQQVPLPGDDGNNGSTGGSNTYVTQNCEDCIKPCEDGTLNCYFDFDDDDFDDFVPTSETEAASGYQTCMNSCLAENPDCIGMPLTSITPACLDTFQDCRNVCDIFNETFNVFDGLAESDPIMIPQPSKAILVTVEGCYSRGESTVTFQGPSLRTQKLATKGKYYTDKTHPHERVYIGKPISADSSCSWSRRGKISVVVKPWRESTITVGGTTHEVIPFNDSIEEEFNLVWKRPQTTAFQLPAELSEQVDFSQTGWMAYSMPQPASYTLFSGTTFVDFVPNYSQYHNGTPNLGQGIMMIYGTAREAQQSQPSFTMVAFVRSR